MVTRRAACSGPARSFQEADVCRGRGCWRTEGWAPELKQKRGRPASAVADGHELAVQSFISLILQIEGQRYKAPFVAALALTASPLSPNPLACASQVLRPDQRSDAAPRALRRCRAVEPLLPRARHAQDERAAPGLPNQRGVCARSALVSCARGARLTS